MEVIYEQPPIKFQQFKEILKHKMGDMQPPLKKIWKLNKKYLNEKKKFKTKKKA